MRKSPEKSRDKESRPPGSEAALIGHVPRNVWLTRLDMNITRSALERDCALEAAQDRSQVEPHMEASQVRNHPCPADDQVAAAIKTADPGPIGRLPPWLFGVLVVASWFIRRRNAPSKPNRDLVASRQHP